jgi:hypothetical protein
MAPRVLIPRSAYSPRRRAGGRLGARGEKLAVQILHLRLKVHLEVLHLTIHLPQPLLPPAALALAARAACGVAAAAVARPASRPRALPPFARPAALVVGTVVPVALSKGPTGRKTRRVQLVRGEGRDVSS